MSGFSKEYVQAVPRQTPPREAFVQKNGGAEEISSVSAREAPLLENGGEPRASMATDEQQTLCHASPGRGEMGRSRMRRK